MKISEAFSSSADRAHGLHQKYVTGANPLAVPHMDLPYRWAFPCAEPFPHHRAPYTGLVAPSTAGEFPPKSLWHLEGMSWAPHTARSPKPRVHVLREHSVNLAE